MKGGPFGEIFSTNKNISNVKLAAYILEPGQCLGCVDRRSWSYNNSRHPFSPENCLIGVLFQPQGGSSFRAPWRRAGTLNVWTNDLHT